MCNQIWESFTLNCRVVFMASLTSSQFGPISWTRTTRACNMEEKRDKVYLKWVMVIEVHLFRKGHNIFEIADELQTTWSSNSDQGLPEPGCPAEFYKNRNNKLQINKSVWWQVKICYHMTNNPYVHTIITFNALAFLPLSRPLMILINLLGLDMLLICEAAGEGLELVIGAILSNVSSDCFVVFGFLTLGCPYKPS